MVTSVFLSVIKKGREKEEKQTYTRDLPIKVLYFERYDPISDTLETSHIWVTPIKSNTYYTNITDHIVNTAKFIKMVEYFCVRHVSNVEIIVSV